MQAKLKTITSAGLLALCSAGWTPLFGQEAAPTPTPTPTPATTTTTSTTSQTEPVVMEAVSVEGFRSSLASAEEIKQNSQEFVDSIVASDIDKLPDINVSYALSRIPGIQVAHTFAGLGGNGAVTIDGLTQIENTIDGREVFTPGGLSGGGIGNGQRTFDYSQIPSQLVEGIDVYKTAAANQIEGGLVGTIDVRMRKPFDFGDGLHFGGSWGETYAGLDNESRPSYSGYFSDVEKTSIGKIGVMVSASLSDTPWREDDLGIGNPTSAPLVTTGVPTALIDSGYDTSTAWGTFKTIGLDGVVQWAPSDAFKFYAGVNIDQWRNTEAQTQFLVGLSAAQSVAGSGIMFPGSATATEAATFDNVTSSAYSDIRDLTDRMTTLFVGGGWHQGDWGVDFDVSHFESAYNFVNNGAFASVAIPSLTYHINGDIPSATVSGASMDDPSIYKIVQVFNRLYPATGDDTVGKLDLTYNVNNSFLSKILAGFRYSSTEQDDGATGLILGSYSLPATDNLISQHPGLFETAPIQNFFSGYAQPEVDQYLVPGYSLMRDPNALLQAYGDTTTTATTDNTVNPLSLFRITEDTLAFYVMPEYSFKLGTIVVDGNIGLRAVNTKDDLGGYQTVTPASESSTGKAIIGPIEIDKSYTDWLPSFNGRIEFTDKLYLRLAASKTITRPNFSSLSPSLTLNENPINPNANSGTQGNPNLQPIRSTNVDVSLEYYYTKDDMVYLTGFYKDVQGFIASTSYDEEYGGATYLISTSANLNPATIRGAEAGFQQFFSFLPEPFRGFGVQANVTYVESTTPSAIAGVTVPLTNLSRASYNLVGMYEHGPFSARIAYNWRSKYLTGVSYFVNAGLLDQDVRAYGDLDASINYNLTKNIEISLQGTNLTNTLRYQYWGSPEFPSNLYLDGITLMGTISYRF